MYCKKCNRPVEWDTDEQLYRCDECEQLLTMAQVGSPVELLMEEDL